MWLVDVMVLNSVCLYLSFEDCVFPEHRSNFFLIRFAHLLGKIFLSGCGSNCMVARATSHEISFLLSLKRSRAKRRLRVSIRGVCLSSKPRKTGSSFNPEITKFHREVRIRITMRTFWNFLWNREIESAMYEDEILSFSSHQCFRLFSR